MAFREETRERIYCPAHYNGVCSFIGELVACGGNAYTCTAANGMPEYSRRVGARVMADRVHGFRASPRAAGIVRGKLLEGLQV